MIQKGKYALSIENNIPYLTLRYVSDENGKFTDSAIAPTVHKFDLSESDLGTFEFLRIMLNHLDQKTVSKKEVRYSPICFMMNNMKEVGAEYSLAGTLLAAGQMPESVLK